MHMDSEQNIELRFMRLNFEKDETCAQLQERKIISAVAFEAYMTDIRI